MFCSLQLQYECKFFFLSRSSGIYTESDRSKEEPYPYVEKCAMIIFDNKIIQIIKLDREDTGFVDI